MRSFGLMARSWQLCRGKTYAFGRAWCFRCSDLWRVVRRWRLGSASTSLLPWVASAVEDKPDIDNSPRASCGHLRVNEGCLVFPAAQWLPDGHSVRRGRKGAQPQTRNSYIQTQKHHTKLYLTPRVQVPNNHILSKILPYITTILKPST